jgi:spermidine synthase
MTSAENYINEECRRVLRSLFATLKAVFPEVRFLPGARTLFLGVRSPGTVSLDPRVLERRLRERGLETSWVKPGYWDERFDRLRLGGLERMLAVPGEINQDLRPVLFASSLSFWSTHFNSLFARFMQMAEHGLLLLWCLVLFVFFPGLKSGFRLPLVTATAGGFQLMIIKSSVLILFQALFGYVYSWFGLITAVFLAGVCAGAWLAENRKSLVSWKMLALASAVSFTGAAVLPFLAVCGAGWFSLSGLFLLSFCAGAVSGGQFAVAVSSRAVPGKLYAADVLGSVLGLVLGGVVLVPLWGSSDTLVFCALLQLGLMTAFIRQDRWCCGKKALP